MYVSQDIVANRILNNREMVQIAISQAEATNFLGTKSQDGWETTSSTRPPIALTVIMDIPPTGPGLDWFVQTPGVRPSIRLGG